MDTRNTINVDQTVVITQKLMEIGGELENAGKCVIYKTSICMKSIYFIKYLAHSSDTTGYPFIFSFKKCSFSDSIAMHKMEADFVFMKVRKADMN